VYFAASRRTTSRLEIWVQIWGLNDQEYHALRLTEW
jgi:hypothetical protein